MSGFRVEAIVWLLYITYYTGVSGRLNFWAVIFDYQRTVLV